MKGLIRLLLAVLLMVVLGGIHHTLEAQTDSNNQKQEVYQLSGMVLEPDNGNPIAYVGISINRESRGGFSNETGFFSLPVTKEDTLFFNRLGYKTSSVPVQAIIEDNKEKEGTNGQYLYTVEFMERDTMRTETVEVYPYNNPHEIKMAILNMPTPTEAKVEAARNSLSYLPANTFAAKVPEKAYGSQALARQEFYRSYGVRNTRATATLISSEQIVRLIQYLGEKSETKKEKVYNYWPSDVD